MKGIICLCLAMQLLVVASKSLLDALRPCHKSDPNFAKCYWNFINGGIALVNNEIPGYNVPFTNPLKISILNTDVDIENLGSGNGTMKNIKITNLFKVKVTGIKTDLENMIFEFNLTHPKVSFEFEYLLDGILFDNPIHSEGFLKAKIIRVDSIFTFKFNSTERRGVKYYTIDDFKLQMSVGDAAVHITSKNPEEQSAADFLQNLFNQNARLYLDILNPFYVGHVKRLLLPVLDGALAIVPADKILLE